MEITWVSIHTVQILRLFKMGDNNFDMAESVSISFNTPLNGDRQMKA